MQSRWLFDESIPVPETKKILQQKLHSMAQQNLFLGGSSWKYPGWLGQIYTPERYQTRGKFSKTRFDAECLNEYAETFPVVCGDFSLYQFPSVDFWKKLFSETPSSLQFAFKVPEEITVPVFHNQLRNGDRAGTKNPNFLNPELLRLQFLNLLEPYRDRVALILFEFATFPPSAVPSVDGFLKAFASLAAALPNHFRYAVEIRTPEFLCADYFQVLRDANIAHAFNCWTRMPSITEQAFMPGSFTADFIVARAIVRPGRSYEEAVRMFSPYREVREPNQRVRTELRKLLLRAKRLSQPAYIFVNNRMEGNTPGTIEAVVANWE